MPPASDDQVLQVLLALGCTRLDVVGVVGGALGCTDVVGLLARAEGVQVSGDHVAIDREALRLDAVDRVDLVEAGTAAGARLLELGELEEAGRLAMVAGLPDLLRQTVRAALRVPPPRAPAHVLRAWRDALVLDVDDPHARWLEVACAEVGPSRPPDLLDRYEAVRRSFEESGDVDAEISVGLATAIHARRADDLATLVRLTVRADELLAAGREEALAPAVLGEVIRHQVFGAPQAALDALDRFPRDRLAGDWAAQVAMLRGTNLLLLDEPEAAVEAFEVASGHGSSWTYAVALELLATARWNTGDRAGAIDDLCWAEVVANQAGAVGTARLARAHRAVLEAADGRAEAAATARRAASDVGDAEEDRLLQVAAALRAIGTGAPGAAAPVVATLPVPERAVRSAHWTVALRAALGIEVAALDGVVDAHSSLAAARDLGSSAAASLAAGDPASSSARRLLPGSWCEPVPPAVEIQLLGGAAVRLDGRPVAHPDWDRARVRELCLHLALVRTSSRERVATRLWPDLPAASANRNLRVTLTYLSSVLEPTRVKGAPRDLIEEAGGMLTFADTTRLRIDVRDALRAAERIVTGAAVGDDVAVTRGARELARLPGGELLGGGSTSTWVEAQDASRREQVLRAAVAGAPRLLRLGNAALAETLAQRGLDEDPWAERLHQVLVRACLARDDLDAARRALRRALGALDELGVAPEPPTVELARLVGMAR